MTAAELEFLGELEEEFETAPQLGYRSYLGEFEQEAMELEPLFTRAGPFGRYGEEAWRAPELPPPPLLPIPGTIHRLDCPAGCPLPTVAQCRAVVRQAIKVAIDLANNAANKLEAPTKLEPAKRDQDANKTAGFFKSFFGHDPSTLIDNEPSGVSIAKRFRSVAKELGGGRRMIFRCVAATCAAGAASTPGNAAQAACCSVGSRAFTVPDRPDLISVVHLCPPFWNLPEGSRGGTIIHEMLHLFFAAGPHGFLRDTGRRANAHCYKAFALRVKGYGRDLDATCQCWELPMQQCRQRLGLP
jgi:hypothetical protein